MNMYEILNLKKLRLKFKAFNFWISLSIFWFFYMRYLIFLCWTQGKINRLLYITIINIVLTRYSNYRMCNIFSRQSNTNDSSIKLWFHFPLINLLLIYPILPIDCKLQVWLEFSKWTHQFRDAACVYCDDPKCAMYIYVDVW